MAAFTAAKERAESENGEVWWWRATGDGRRRYWQLLRRKATREYIKRGGIGFPESDYEYGVGEDEHEGRLGEVMVLKKKRVESI